MWSILKENAIVCVGTPLSAEAAVARWIYGVPLRPDKTLLPRLPSLKPFFIELAARFLDVRPVIPNPIQKSLGRRQQTLSERR